MLSRVMGWMSFSPRRTRRWLRTSLLVVGGAAVGWAGSVGWRPEPSSSPEVVREIPLAAAGAMNTERFAVATGPVDDEVEGLFILDFVTGELQCQVMNVRNSRFGGSFRTNVLQDLGTGPRKNNQLALVTGESHFARAGRVARVGRSVAYVLDPSTGIYAAYALKWRPELAAAGRQQSGALELLDRGQLAAPVSAPVTISTP